MIHQYKNNGYNIVMDVNSGSVHSVDEVVYDVIEMFSNIIATDTDKKIKAADFDTYKKIAVMSLKGFKERPALGHEETLHP